MTVTVFADTNVLVYARDTTEPEKQRRALEWMAWLWDLRAGRLSVQVLQEYYVTVTRKLDPPRDEEDAREDVLSLFAWKPEAVGVEVFERAWAIQDRFGFSWWDALIVAAAVLARSSYLLSEDLQDGQRVEGVQILNPFKHAPEEILGGR